MCDFRDGTGVLLSLVVGPRLMQGDMKFRSSQEMGHTYCNSTAKSKIKTQIFSKT